MSNTDKICKAIQDGSETTKEIVEATGLTPSIVRKGLAKLRKEETVEAIKVGSTWHHTPFEGERDSTVVHKGQSVGCSEPVVVEGVSLGAKMDSLTTVSATNLPVNDRPTVVKPGKGSITIRSTNKTDPRFRRVTRLQAQSACDSGKWTITSKTAWRRWKKAQS